MNSLYKFHIFLTMAYYFIRGLEKLCLVERSLTKNMYILRNIFSHNTCYDVKAVVYKEPCYFPKPVPYYL